MKKLIVLLMGLGLYASSAQAGACSWSNPGGCIPKFPKFPRPSSGGGSCLGVESHPQSYEWHIRNNTNFKVFFKIDGKDWSVNAGQTIYFTSKVGYSGSSSCSSVYLPEPSITFDYIANNGRWDNKGYRVAVKSYRSYVFQQNGNYINFHHVY